MEGVSKMNLKPKDRIIKDDGFHMHVPSSKATTVKVNPLRIEQHSQKEEAITITGSEIEADTNSRAMMAAAGSF